jgi:hypothetical protein
VDGLARLWDARGGQAWSEPLAHGGELTSVQFSPDGSWLLTASKDGTARIWEVHRAPAPAPPWLADLAEAIAGQRLDDKRHSQGIPPEQLLEVIERIMRNPANDPYARWARWFLSDPAARSASAQPQAPARR